MVEDLFSFRRWFYSGFSSGISFPEIRMNFCRIFGCDSFFVYIRCQNKIEVTFIRKEVMCDLNVHISF